MNDLKPGQKVLVLDIFGAPFIGTIQNKVPNTRCLYKLDQDTEVKVRGVFSGYVSGQFLIPVDSNISQEKINLLLHLYAHKNK